MPEMGNVSEYLKKAAKYDISEAKIRFLHASPDAPKIDIYVNRECISTDIHFKKITEYVFLPKGELQIDLYPTGNKVNSFISEKIKVERGKSYTLAFIGKINSYRLIPYLNQLDVPIGEAKIRFLHLSPDAPSLDIAVKNRDVTFPKVLYEKETDYLGLTPMTIDLEAREFDTKNVILEMSKSRFLPNKTYTIVLVGFIKEGPEIEALFIID